MKDKNTYHNTMAYHLLSALRPSGAHTRSANHISYTFRKCCCSLSPHSSLGAFAQFILHPRFVTFLLCILAFSRALLAVELGQHIHHILTSLTGPLCLAAHTFRVIACGAKQPPVLMFLMFNQNLLSLRNCPKCNATPLTKFLGARVADLAASFVADTGKLRRCETGFAKTTNCSLWTWQLSHVQF